jgi:hypothetical protein
LHRTVVELNCNLRKRFEGQLLSPPSHRGVFRSLSAIWPGRRDLIPAPEGVRVLMVSIAERVMDGSDPVYKEIAGLSAARRVMRP